jgi:uncharacterized membrane protein YphA (DoxX/SURF4 family)
LRAGKRLLVSAGPVCIGNERVLMVIAGWHTRVGAALIALNMLLAIGLVHVSELLAVGPSGGWALELQGMFLLGALAMELLGPGRLGVDVRRGAATASQVN